MTIKAEVFINERSSGIWYWRQSSDFRGWLQLMSGCRQDLGQTSIKFPVWETQAYYQPPIKTAEYRVEVQL